MKIGVTRLRSNMALLHKVVPKKPTLSSLVNVQMKDGKLIATYLEKTVVIDLFEVGKENFLIPYHKVLETLKYVPGDEILEIDASREKILRMIWSAGSASFPTMKSDDYPRLPEINARVTGDLNGDILLKAMTEALPYRANESTRPVLTGVCLTLGPVSCQVACADGFRVSYQSVNLHYPSEETLVIPGETVGFLQEIWGKRPAVPNFGNTLIEQITAPRNLNLSVWNFGAEDNKQTSVAIKFGDITVISRLLTGTFPDVLALLGGFKEPIKACLMAPELYNAARRVKEISAAGTGSVRLIWTEEKMTVSAYAAEEGEISVTIPVDGATPGYIAVNNKYLLEYLAGKEGAIEIGMAAPSSPLVFHYGNRPVVAIMPMFVKWEEVEGLPLLPGQEKKELPAPAVDSAPPKEPEPEPEPEPVPGEGDGMENQEREEEPGEEEFETEEETPEVQEDPEDRQYDEPEETTDQVPEPAGVAGEPEPKKRGRKKKTE